MYEASSWRMLMFPLSYNTNGLVKLPLERAVVEVSTAGYQGVEISLHPDHLLPFDVSRERLNQLKDLFGKLQIKPVCLATGGMNVLGEVAFEPSLISPDEEGRKRRIELIMRALEIANYLSIPCVNFTSGIRHEGIPAEEAMDMLKEGMRACLKNAGQAIMVLEPEPLIPPWSVMFIHTTSQAIPIIREIDSPQLRLNVDISHIKCAESDVVQCTAAALPYTRHIHIADIKGRVHHHEIPGEADIDFRGLLQALRKGKYAYYLSVELYWHIDDWERALYQARRYLLEQMQASQAGN
jgi:hydroxypyruvate isomerase